MVLLLALLILFYAFFEVLSDAIVRARTARVRDLGREGISGVRLARMVCLHRQQFAMTCRAGTLLAAVALGAVVASALLTSTVWSGSGGGWWTTLAVLAVAVAALLLVEVVRRAALREPELVLCKTALPLRFLSRLLVPLVAPIGLVLRRTRTAGEIRRAEDAASAASAEEISEMVDQSTRAGELDEEEREMIQGVFTSADTVVREVMTPRADVITVHHNASLAEVVKVFTHEGVSRVLVVGDELDDVKGTVYVKDLIPFVGRDSTGFSLQSIIRPPYFVPNTKRVNDLLDELRTNAVHLAVVLDERGGVDGLVTIEDLIEEIVGEIFDEYDRPGEEAEIRRLKSGDLLVSGGILVGDLNRRTSLELPEGEYDTLAGFVIHLLGRIPHQGEIVDSQGAVFRIERVEQNRIILLRVLNSKKPSIASRLAAESVETKAASPESNQENRGKILHASGEGA